MDETLIARKRSDGKRQSVREHSENVAGRMAAAKRYPNTSKLLAYLHDLGKLSEAFQDYIERGGARGSVIHAWQGAFLADELFPDEDLIAKLLKEIVGFCVTAHHNRLDDGVSPDGRTDYFDKFSNPADARYFYDAVKGKLAEADKSRLQSLFADARPEIGGVLAEIKAVYRTGNSANFALGLFVKYLFSCLVDADRLDAYSFETGEEYSAQDADWGALIGVFEDYITGFPADAEIDRIRKAVSDKCKAAARRETGIYQLSVPTGGGKTLSSFRFALHHCREYHKKRIIYVIPYLSIIEQTAESLRDSLNLTEADGVIFEHHSDIVEPEDEEAAQIRALASARWDSPVIVTTMVQFMESVMSAKSGKLRKFASMADSVIIFDEIQAMPLKLIHCFNEVVSFLSKILNATVILCSATQPTLEATQRKNLLLHENAKLIDCSEEFENLRRVQVVAEEGKDCRSASDFILEKANENGDCLVIVNTKKSALSIYRLLRDKTAEFEVLHLSTSMCPRHRKDLLKKLKASLKNREKVICVSTQLIEAGVDISFACVVRAMAGLDAVAQAAGRCNRNGKSSHPKDVYTFPLKDENLDKLHDIESGKEITAQLVRNKTEASDLLDEATMTEFYSRYFAGKDSQMDYPTKDGNWIYTMLSGNEGGKRNYTNRTGQAVHHWICHAFRSAGDGFSVIDQPAKPVVVMWDEAGSLVEEYRKQPAEAVTREKINILKKLQSYSVSLYDWELRKLGEQYALYPLDEETGVLLLAENYYSGETGVVLTSVQDTLIVSGEG